MSGRGKSEWTRLHQHIGARMDGLVNDHPIELMQRAVATLKGWLGQRHATQ
jgi:hypothetical protein